MKRRRDHLTRIALAALGALGAMAQVIMTSCSERLEHFPSLPARQSLNVLAQRQERIETIEATGAIDLVSANGDSARLDVAMVAQPPDRLRLRAWKIDHAVFDVTLAGEAVWIARAEPTDAPGRSDSLDIGQAADGLQFVLDVLSGSLYRAASVDNPDATSGAICAHGSVGEVSVDFTIDRRTLIAREFTGADDLHRLRVSLSDYRMIGDVAWPMQVRVRSEAGQFTLRFAEVDLNGELSPAAFRPPASAVQRP